jgi:crotonobetainyl-CoA:carnitine CoA-transferase CaiB-like acyl-CoA transferase
MFGTEIHPISIGEPCMLDSIRVLDLTDHKGYLCGRMLGDLGADVIKIEKPGGDPGRRTGPFYQDTPHPEKSLYWYAYNANKRSITLDIESRDGIVLFKKLISTADAIIESFTPGYMDRIGLGYEALCEVNSRVVLTSISPFGQVGPYSHFECSDIVLMAMGGYMFTCGEPDRPPVRIGFPQAYLFAGAEAAAGTLMALYHCQGTGEGQHVDISVQHSVTGTSSSVVTAFWYLQGMILPRAGQYRVGFGPGMRQRQLWPCKDGFISFQIYGGIVGAKSNRILTQWMDSEGYADNFLKEIDWENLSMEDTSQEMMDRIESSIAKFFLIHTKAELEEEALIRDIMLYPVNTIGDLLRNPQLRARKFWAEVEHPELNCSITYPGGWARCSDYDIKIKRAPLIGEHNVEIYQRELGLSEVELLALRGAGTI